MKLDLNGDTLWTRSIGGNNTDVGFSIDILNNGFIIAGNSKSFNTNQKIKSYVVKTDTNGNLQWQRTYSNNGGDWTWSIKHKPNYGYIMSGSSDSLNNNVYMAKLRAIDFSGNIIFENSFILGNDENDFYNLELTSDGGYILGGFSKNDPGGSRLLAVKTDSLGKANPIGIGITSNNIPEYFLVFQNYPNPFNSTTIIKYDLKTSAFIKLLISDINGREIVVINESYKLAGKYNFILNAEQLNLSSGIYFYTLQFIDPQHSENLYSISKKLIFLK